MPDQPFTLAEELERVAQLYRAYKGKREDDRRLERTPAREKLCQLTQAAIEFADLLRRFDEEVTPEQYRLVTWVYHKIGPAAGWPGGFREDVEAVDRLVSALRTAAEQQPRPRGPEPNELAIWLADRLKGMFGRHVRRHPGGWRSWVYERAIEIDPKLDSSADGGADEINRAMGSLKRSKS